MTIDALLFDLDGTLVNTAPDLQAAVNYVIAEYHCPPIDQSKFKYHINGGSESMLAFGLGITTDDVKFKQAKKRFLQYYHDHISVKSYIYSGIKSLLDMIHSAGLLCGVVTNKSQLLSERLLQDLGLDKKIQCLVTSDHVERIKPEPDSLFLASNILGVDPKRCMYIGDVETDCIAAKKAGMIAVSVLYGYHSPESDPDLWDTDHRLYSSTALYQWFLDSNKGKSIEKI